MDGIIIITGDLFNAGRTMRFNLTSVPKKGVATLRIVFTVFRSRNVRVIFRCVVILIPPTWMNTIDQYKKLW